MPSASVVSVSRDGTHRFSKAPCPSVTLVAGLGVLGDAHAGSLVQHRSRVRRDPNQSNLRQVHLLHVELFEDARYIGLEILRQSRLTVIDGEATSEEVLPAAITA